MYEVVPDNYDAFEELEAEQERRQRMRKRLAYIYGEAEREGGEEDEQYPSGYYTGECNHILQL